MLGSMSQVTHRPTKIRLSTFADGRRFPLSLLGFYGRLLLLKVCQLQDAGTGMFPEVALSWATFNQVQRIIDKTAGKTCAASPARLMHHRFL